MSGPVPQPRESILHQQLMANQQRTLGQGQGDAGSAVMGASGMPGSVGSLGPTGGYYGYSASLPNMGANITPAPTTGTTPTRGFTMHSTGMFNPLLSAVDHAASPSQAQSQLQQQHQQQQQQQQQQHNQQLPLNSQQQQQQPQNMSHSILKDGNTFVGSPISPVSWNQHLRNTPQTQQPMQFQVQQHPSQIIGRGSQRNNSIISETIQDEDYLDGGGKAETGDKRARRRASHNAVERRRRDLINEKIQELSTLLPDHHLLPADAQNKGSILRRSVDHLRGVQALAGRQADRITELEGVCRALMQRAGVPESDLVMTLPLGTTFELPVAGMPGGGVTGNQLAGALMAAAAAQQHATNNGQGMMSMGGPEEEGMQNGPGLGIGFSAQQHMNFQGLQEIMRDNHPN
ncbi:hypothetical protein BC830DRAFT_1095991 [Chytriomyces sp. MP71]|nr:hypothetical protein BC830DRAFT_1095991 [Chytriomyces sp. MP71]